MAEEAHEARPLLLQEPTVSWIIKAEVASSEEIAHKIMCVHIKRRNECIFWSGHLLGLALKELL